LWLAEQKSEFKRLGIPFFLFTGADFGVHCDYYFAFLRIAVPL
jgi:hypothetical protein